MPKGVQAIALISHYPMIWIWRGSLSWGFFPLPDLNCRNHQVEEESIWTYLIQVTNTIGSVSTSINRSPWRRGFLLIPLGLALAWLVLSPTARAVDPPPDGGYPNDNTAEGEDALFNLTTGIHNTATGYHALFSNTTGLNNTATGWEALEVNTTGIKNTATGCDTLHKNTTGSYDTASGVGALAHNTLGAYNTANGFDALHNNKTGSSNIALGDSAGIHNTTGNNNIDIGNLGAELSLPRSASAHRAPTQHLYRRD